MSSPANLCVLNWLNNEINLNPNVDNIQMEFKNGFRFADILLSLKLISKDEFLLFKDSTKIEEIKNNFILLKKFLHSILNLEIRLEEFDEIINNDKYKSTIIIYKIKNAYYKNKIHFNEIKNSIYPPTREELEEKIKTIVENTLDEKNYEEQKDIKEIRNLKKDKSLKLILSHKFKNDLNTIEDEQSKVNIKPIKIKKLELPIIKNGNLRYKSALKIERDKVKVLKKNQSQLNLKKSPFLSFEGNLNISNKEALLDKNRLTNNLMRYGLSYENIKKNNSINELFQKNKFGNKKNEPTIRRNNIIVKKMNNSIVYDVPEINFIRKDKKFLDNITNILNNKKNAFSFLESNFILHNVSDNSKNKTSSKMAEYAKMREIDLKREKSEKRFNFFKKLIYLNQKKQNLFQKNKFKRIYSSTGNIFHYEEEKFNKDKYYKEINKLKHYEFKDYVKNRYYTFGSHYEDMKRIIYLIIDITMEGYFYQQEHKTYIMDINLYLKIIKLFLKNKKLRRPKIDNEYSKIKEVNKLEENIDIDKIILSEDETFLLKDYLYYIGLWNKNSIIDNKLIGKKLDYKLVLVDKIKNLTKYGEYEPTVIENEDLTLPKNNIYDYNYGKLVMEIINNKYTVKKEAINNNENNISKWNYIPYKICLIGYPFSGRKHVSEKLIIKYPNLKVYSVQKLLREYISQYKKITEPIENQPKIKSMKKNQIEQIKQEKQKQLEEFEPILNIIKPHLELIENNKENDLCIPPDEVLLKLIIYQIEKEFPQKDRNLLDEEINENKKKINSILAKIETIKNNKTEKKEKKDKKEKSKNSKINQKDKDEATILNLEKEIEKIKLESVKGFILVDFPTNFNQCYLLEHYLTGYIDELQKPKTLKNKILQALNNIIDIKYFPSENKTIKKGGIDYIIDIKLKEEEVNKRFNSIKYDPIEDKILSTDEYEQINNKKVLEKITNEIPYFGKNIFEYYKKEYDDNIPKINLFYNKFGFIPNENTSRVGTSIFTTENDQNNKIIKIYQSIKIDKIIENNQEVNENKVNENKQENKKNKKISKRTSLKQKKIKENKNNIKNENTNLINNVESNNLSDEQIINTILDFITDKIKILYEEINKNEKSGNKDSNKESEDPSITRSEARKSRTKKQTALVIEKDKIILNIKVKSENIINELLSLDTEYNNNLKVFIYLLNKQRFEIYNRLNLIQKKFRDFLNRGTNKKKLLHTYISKYNNFYKNNPNLLENENVKKEFMADIEDINISLWKILNHKKIESIDELQEIKNCGYIEIELCKFFNHIKELFIVEARKFLGMVNIILDFYIKNFLDERINYLKKNISSSTHNNANQLIELRYKIDNFFENKKFKEDYIFNGLISIKDAYIEEKNRLDNNDIQQEYIDENNIEQINIDNRSKYTIFTENILSILLKNINTLFINSIQLLLNQNEKIVPFLQILTEVSNALNRKPKIKNKKSQILVNETLSSNSSVFGNMSSFDNNILISEENIKKLIEKEKIKYKYRLCFIKSFSTKFMLIISQLNQNIFHNADDWIIKSVNMENDAQNEVMNILKRKLEEKKLIDEENEINTIEMDCFEKIIEEENNSNNQSIDIKMKPIDNSSVINSNRVYNKINIDYLIKDNLFDIKIEKIEKEKTENIINNINEDIKEYKIIIPKNNSNCISSCEISERSQITSEEEIIREENYFYDINKFYEIYKRIKKYEIEQNIVSCDNFYEAFIKKYIIYNNEINYTENNNSEIYIENNEELSNTEKNKEVKLNAISNVLKQLNSKQINRLLSFYKIIINKTDNEDKVNEYDDYIKIDEIFTILSLMGCEILTKEKEEKIMNDLKDKIIHEKYLEKKEFMNYHFWFEKNLEYQNKKTNEEKEDIRNEKIGIKDFLFELWEDVSGNINIKNFIDILRVNNYITDLSEFHNKRYYDIIIFG